MANGYIQHTTNTVEQIIIALFNTHIPNVPVGAELPADPSIPCIIIEKTGGGLEETISSATVAVQSYGETLQNAMILNETVKDIMTNKLIEEPEICNVILNTDYNFTDTTAERYRYQAVFDIKYY
jgi:hypothetical protein